MRRSIDLNLLKELAGTMSDYEIAERLHRSVSTVRSWAYALHLSLAFKNQEWTDSELQAATEMRNEGKSFAYIGELLERTPAAIRRKLHNSKKSLQ